MRNQFLRILMLLLSVAALTACAGMPTGMYQAGDLDTKWNAGYYNQKVDNFIVILDSSGSMANGYISQAKLDTATNFLSAMNDTMPDMKLMGALSSFGTGACLGGGDNVMVYGLTNYTEKGLAQGIDKVTCADGVTPISNALMKAGEALKSTSGKIAAILVSDGTRQVMDPNPEGAAEKLKEMYGDRICIYTVLIGDDAGGRALLQNIAKISGCGFFTDAGSIKTGADMADFVEKIFLAKKPDAPKPAPKPAPKKAWILEGVNFDTDKFVIKKEGLPALKNAVMVLKDNPELKIEIQGHTDSDASDAHNQTLSENRAKSVMEYLLMNGINQSRLRQVGYGESKPLVPNDSPENKAKNRRVELLPIK